MKNKMKNAKGITLLSLVITIVILIILATISINWIFGDNGLVNRTEQAKFEHSKAEARERLSLVLADAYVEKNVTQEYTEEEFLYEHLEDFVYEQEPGAKIFEYGDGEVISLNGHSFWLDRSVPQLGDYLGEEGILPPVITRVDVTNKTFTEISIDVKTVGVENAKYKYSIKEFETDDSTYGQVTEKSENTNTFTGLTSPKIYTIKVELIENNEAVDTKTINVKLGEIDELTLSFGKHTWSNGVASMPVNTTTSYQIEYQIGGISEGSWKTIANGGTINNIPNNSDVYARLSDGSNKTDYIYKKIVDDVAPTITKFEATETTSNSIAVQVQAIDNESGMADSVTYKYFVKESSQPDTSYVQKGTDTTGNYTITGLTQGTSYDVKVEATGDKAGNIGIGYLYNQITGELPGGEEGVEQGAITFGTPTWSNGQASITINTNTDLQLQYQKNSTNGSWINIENGGIVTEIQHNDIVYARLTDGTNYGEYASATIVDDIHPIINDIYVKLLSRNSVTIVVDANDNESKIKNYTYYVQGDENPKEISVNNTYEYALLPQTKYTLKVIVTDNANNKTEKTIDVETIGDNVELFSYINKNKWTLGQAGFSAKNNGSQSDLYKFQLNLFQAGHYDGAASYSATYTLDWSKIKLDNPKQIQITGKELANGGGAWVDVRMTIKYSDGTSEVKRTGNVTNTYNEWWGYTLTQDIPEEKNVSSVVFTIVRI